MWWDRLLAAGPVITDGAWGTQLQAQGLVGGVCPDQWNVTYPDRVADIAAQYVAAGSQIVLTNTFRANRVALTMHQLADQLVEINRAGVDLIRRAVVGRAHVCASLGPTGKLLLAGEITHQDVRAAFAEQATILAAAGAEALVIETMADLEEAELAIAAARTTGLPVVACVVLDSGAAHDRTMMGAPPEEAATRLTAAGADVVGANCGQGIAGYVDICRRMRAATDRPLWMKANAGSPQVVGGQIRYESSAAEFAAQAPALVAAGAQFIGGCCGTTPEFIRALCKEIRP